MHVVATLRDDKGQVIGEIIAPEKQFKTGSRGYFGMSKLEINGKRHQIQLQIVEIGSKGTSRENPEPDAVEG